jgi:hypothetical protein
VILLSIPSLWPRQDRVRQSSAALFGNDPQTFRSDFTARAPRVPQMILVEQPVCGSSVLPHYHATDQFQIFIDGGGRLGRQVIKPISIHYTNRYTGYGPIVAGPAGVSYYVLRPEFDPLVTGQYLHVPEKRAALRQHRSHRRAEIVEGIAVKTTSELLQLTAPQRVRVIDAEHDAHDPGLFADVLYLGANMRYTGPDPRSGGGQMYLVIQGSLRCNGAAYVARSSIALTREEQAVTLVAEDAGAQVLVLQYPRRV